MKTNLHYVFFISFFLLTFSIFGQQNYWTSLNNSKETQRSLFKNFDQSAFKTYQLNDAALKQQLIGVPIRGQFSGKSHTIISFPNEYGKLEKFRIIEAPLLSLELSALHPNIKTYLGFSIENSGTRIRFSFTPLGVNAMITSRDKATCFLVPTSKTDNKQYIAYNRNANLSSPKSFNCLTEDTFMSSRENASFSRDANDQILRTFRIAISTTGEYTSFWDDGNAGNGDAKDDALAQVVSTLNRVNELFEVDMAVTFTLVTGSELLYVDAATDPYSTISNFGSELQNTLTTNTGETNYDIGHLFHKEVTANNNNGNANCIGCVCVDNQKGSGFSSHAFTDNDGGTYMSDFFDIDYVSHEIGHQMGANHTWSFEDEGTGVQSEPGSGTTVMSYAGITGTDDVQDHSDPYFHYYSIDQILNNLDTRTCWTGTPITNNPPVANAGNDFTIPQGTAFILKGASTDADGGDTHTYTWEQIDNGISNNGNFGSTKLTGATWRSRPPNTSPNRYMPILSRVITGQLTETNPIESVDNSTWETVSTVARDLNFVLTVRDRSETNSTGQMPQSSFDTMKVTVDDNSGPFLVTSQTTNETWQAGSNQTITWDVANTNTAPVNTTNINILLSVDGGLTFPFPLASNVANDGSQIVTIPTGTTTTNARVIVESSGNLFYAVNNTDFIIEDVEFLLNTSSPSVNVCQLDNAVYNFTYNTFGGFTETAVFSANNIPSGASVVFNPTSAIVDGTAVSMTVSNTGSVPLGNYTVTAVGTAPSATNGTDVNLTVFSSTINATTLSSPTNNAINVLVNTPLSWIADENASNYFVEVATDSGFTNIVDSATVETTNYTTTLLTVSTQYFWRVTASNQCGIASPSAVYSFTTEDIICNNFNATDTPINIPDNNTTGITSVLNVPFANKVSILDVNVTLNLTHPWVGDLTITLTSPNDTQVTLVSSRNDSGDNYTNTVFDDDASNTIASNSAPYTGSFLPVNALSNFNSEFSNGNWTLKVVDNGPEDIGSLDNWSLEICGNPPLNFSLPVSNFSLLIKSETCRSSDNGSVTITAVEPLNYTAQITGNGLDVSNAFTSSTSFNDLAAGNYSVCITVENETTTYQQCFNIVVTEPEDLSVTSRVDTATSRIDLEFFGGVNYTIDLNGTITTTTENQISLPLLQGINHLKVTTNQDCQGVHRETINNSLKTIVFPNPIINDNKLNIITGDTSIKRVDIELYSILGEILMSQSLNLNSGKTILDTSSLSTGMYLLVVKTDRAQLNFKILKK